MTEVNSVVESQMNGEAYIENRRNRVLRIHKNRFFQAPHSPHVASFGLRGARIRDAVLGPHTACVGRIGLIWALKIGFGNVAKPDFCRNSLTILSKC
jgi:hypothetical protein